MQGGGWLCHLGRFLELVFGVELLLVLLLSIALLDVPLVLLLLLRLSLFSPPQLIRIDGLAGGAGQWGSGRQHRERGVEGRRTAERRRR